MKNKNENKDDYKDESSEESEEFNEYTDFNVEEIEELIEDELEQYEDILEEKKDEELERELERIERDRDRLESKIEKLMEKLEHEDEKAQEKVERIRERLERDQEKIENRREKILERLQELKDTADKAKEKYKRMNISLPADMKDEWKDWADDLRVSVSELIRKAMGTVGKSLTNVNNLSDLERNLEKMGEEIEMSVKKSGLEDLGKKIEKTIEGSIPRGPLEEESSQSSVDKERLKKRVKGLIILQKGIPIEKLAQVMDLSTEQAENLIYELAAEGINGTLEEGVFKFSNKTEEVIDILFKIIDRME